jgi:hypothetical protein
VCPADGGGGWWFRFATPCFKQGIMEAVFFMSCSPVLMEMIVVREYIHGECMDTETIVVA